MAVSERGCCVPECGKTRTDDTVLHSFPNPDKDFDRYIAWTQAVGLDTSLDPHYVYRNRRVCHAHFEIKYLTWTRRLSAGAIPTLFLPGSEMAEAPLIDIINRPENVSLDVALPSPSRGSEMGEDPLIDITNRPENVSLDAALSSPSRGSEMDEDPLIDITNRPENVSLDAALPSPSKACQMTSNFENIKLSSFTWLNEPSQWSLADDVLQVTTGNRTDFWQGTWYNFRVNTGHVYGVELKDDFTLEMYIEADFTTLYDQAGLMIYVDEKHWLKAGIEYNDGQPMIGSVLTNEDSDWATGVYPGDPKKFWLRLTKVGAVVCVKYSTDGVTWTLLRLSPFAVAEKYFVGPMCCTPQRDGLTVKFSGLTVRQPDDDILHSN